MAAHVVYEIYKQSDNDKVLYDVIVNTDQSWFDGKLVCGGLRKSINEWYPESEGYIIEVYVLTSGSSQGE